MHSAILMIFAWRCMFQLERHGCKHPQFDSQYKQINK